jgi:hypothetical protein
LWCAIIGIAPQGVGVRFSPISGDGGVGNLPYSTSRTTTNDERNLALSSF